jgi:hypothetical protein
MRHELKVWPEYFEKLVSGEKNFELRTNDRDFKVGDTLHLQEYVYADAEYTGREVERTVDYIVQGEFGLPDDVCVMALKPADQDAWIPIHSADDLPKESRRYEVTVTKDTSRGESPGVYVDIWTWNDNSRYGEDRDYWLQVVKAYRRVAAPYQPQGEIADGK